jgi:hypothetical protein
MKTAIEWLEEKLKESLGEDFDPVRGYFVIAKEMEAEQIIGAYQSDRVPCSEQDAVTYYIETYVGKI